MALDLAQSLAELRPFDYKVVGQRWALVPAWVFDLYMWAVTNQAQMSDLGHLLVHGADWQAVAASWALGGPMPSKEVEAATTCPNCHSRDHLILFTSEETVQHAQFENGMLYVTTKPKHASWGSSTLHCDHCGTRWPLDPKVLVSGRGSQFKS